MSKPCLPPAPPAAAADAAERLQALNTGESFIIQAPAGSGKTELLVQRMLALLAEVDQPEEVVAITFTRKAAAEMRRRVLVALQGTEDAEPAEPHLKQTWSLARSARERDRARGWALQQNPQRLRTLTIDSLSSELARQRPLRSRIGGGLSPTDDCDGLYREAARRALAAVQGSGPRAAAAARLLLHLDHKHQRTEYLLVSLLARREQWLRNLPVSGSIPESGSTAAWRHILEGALQRLVGKALAQLQELLGKELGNELIAVLQIIAKNQGLTAAAGGYAGLVQPPRGKTQNRSESPSLPNEKGDDQGDDQDSGDYPAKSTPLVEEQLLEQHWIDWQVAAKFLLTNDGSYRKRFTKAEGVLSPSAAKGEEKREREAFKARVLELLEQVKALDGEFQEALHQVRALPYLRYPEHQWQTVEALLLLLPEAVQQLRRTFSTQGVVDFVEVASAASKALGSPLPAGGRENIRHLLVDEFQDTSVTQQRLLLLLIADWRPGGGRTLFLVGDPMQSIYRFREAEVGLFLRVRNEGLAALRPRPLTLVTNFRSGRAVVDFINGTFPQVFPAQEDADTGAVPYSPAQAAPTAAAGTGVEVHFSIERDDEQEAAQVVAIVRATPVQHRIAILVRSRPHAAAIFRALREAQISYQAVEMDPLASQPAVADLIALSRALLHPADRIAWLAVLRAPWCGLGLDHLLQLVGDPASADLTDRGLTILEIISDPNRTRTLPPDESRRLKRVWEVLKHALAERGRHPLRRWIEETWTALGGPACIQPAAVPEVDTFLSTLGRLDAQSDPATLEDLEVALERLYAPPDPLASDRLQVMTIHKAKGLEFDTVILPGLGRKPRNPDQELLHWWERGSAAGKVELLLAPIAAAGEEDPCHQFLRQVHRQQDRHEIGRLLYVAATRAKDTLHLLGHVKSSGGDPKPEQHSLLYQLWGAVSEQFPRQTEPAPEDNSGGGVGTDGASDGANSKRTGLTAPHLEQPGAEAQLVRLPEGWALPGPEQWPKPVGLDFQALKQEPAGPFPSPTRFRARPTARYIGTVIHQSLHRMADHGATAHTEEWIARRQPHHRALLRLLGVPDAELKAALHSVETALQRILADKRGRWILADHQEARSEFALTTSLDEGTVHVVIDRTFVDAGHRWIVDYKTGAHQGGDVNAFLDEEEARYRPQLDRYARVLHKLDERPISLGLYFPLLQAWREWTAELP